MTENEGDTSGGYASSNGGCVKNQEGAAKRRSSPYPTDDPILARIGRTPLIEYPEPTNGADILLKLESDNPTGSMKDRIALGIIRELEDDGELADVDIIVEASSGNTAGAVSLVTNRLGYDSVLTTPAGTSSQKIGYVRSFGSEIVECPNVDSDHEQHYRKTAKRIAEERDGIWLDQYSNQLNPTVHSKWTGPELWDQTGGDLTHIVCPMGTGGTLSGIGKYVTEQDSDVRIIGVDAEQSNISASFYGTDSGTYDTDVEGLGKGHELPTMWFEYVDEVQSVSDERAFVQARRAAADCGILVGGSSGAALAVARDITTEQPNACIAVIGCDGGEQYFDTIFDDTWMQEHGYSTEYR
ncbi:cysteine synthase family protein [Natrinema zhouii]|uniref:Cysteine synthase family protein n=1 Tax=Natrinema zhouii TaxID=1710539 RepID=A0A7D6CPY3_9EURY|nr:cysteine synthase family protein [Natrinema zhouii]QLK27057.1 cysteine synthase family protein [Natrinema zhouii]